MEAKPADKRAENPVPARKKGKQDLEQSVFVSVNSRVGCPGGGENGQTTVKSQGREEKKLSADSEVSMRRKRGRKGMLASGSRGKNTVKPTKALLSKPAQKGKSKEIQADKSRKSIKFKEAKPIKKTSVSDKPSQTGTLVSSPSSAKSRAKPNRAVAKGATKQVGYRAKNVIARKPILKSGAKLSSDRATTPAKTGLAKPKRRREAWETAPSSSSPLLMTPKKQVTPTRPPPSSSPPFNGWDVSRSSSSSPIKDLLVTRVKPDDTVYEVAMAASLQVYQ